MKRRLRFLLPYSDRQLRILEDCINKNSEDEYQWKLLNILVPVVVIILPIIVGLLFVKDFDFYSYMLNGSVSLLGINILLSMSSFLINVNKSKKKSQRDEDIDNDESQLDQDVLYLRGRLDIYRNVLLVLGVIFYISPTIVSDFVSPYAVIAFFISAALISIASIHIGKSMFIIKDDFFNKTFYSEISETVVNARNRFQDKF